jgi:hypothetical protein
MRHQRIVFRFLTQFFKKFDIKKILYLCVKTN